MRAILLSVCVLLFTMSSAFAQITDVIPGADDNGSSPACGASGTTIFSAGNPPPAYRLSKPCPTAQPAFAYADIVSPLEGGPVSALTSAGFDIQDGTHCGAGAPRYQLALDGGSFYVITLGCTAGTATSLGNGWTRITYNTAQIQTAVLASGGNPASIITDMYILFDEGNDTPAGGGIGTPGTAVIDNIMVNGVFFGDASASIPLFGGWALMALATAMVGIGVLALRR
jgi:hypothetical protein